VNRVAAQVFDFLQYLPQFFPANVFPFPARTTIIETVATGRRAVIVRYYPSRLQSLYGEVLLPTKQLFFPFTNRQF